MKTAIIITWIFWGILMLADRVIRIPAFVIAISLSAIFYLLAKITDDTALYSSIIFHSIVIFILFCFFIKNWRKPKEEKEKVEPGS